MSKMTSGPWSWAQGHGFLALPDDGRTHPGVLVFMEAAGLDESVKEVCRRLAQQGYCALAPDLFHGTVFTPAQREEMLAHLQNLKDSDLMADSDAALAALAAGPAAGQPIAVFGMCMGGRLAVLAQCTFGERIAAGVSFYGGGIAPEKDRFGRPSLLEALERVHGPLLLLYGAEDASILPDEHARIAGALSRARKRYTLTVFPGAGHAFLNPYRPSHVPEVAADAWRMVDAFLAQSLAG